ncbi:hypothetical protein WC29P3_00055 [Weissella phage WC29P3]|nr:hypothetical protein WC29P3_00055 [Weissella phage WC29P3]
MKKVFRTITAANYRHYSYVYSIMRNDGMTKLNVAAAMNISFRNADLFEYDYTNSLKKGLTRR